jgi:phosphoglycolate phosphatase
VDSKSATLIFDLDGTLTDPRLGIVRSANHALRTHGLPLVSDELIVAEIGPPLDEMFRKIVPPGSAQVVDSLVATYRERYASVGFSENAVYPEIPQAVAELADAGWRLGICTSKRRDFAEEILSLFGLTEHFTFVDGGDIGITKDEQLARLLSGEVIGADAVMIGDRAVDISAARAVGLASIAVLWGFGSADEIAAAKPSHTAATVDGLLRIVGALPKTEA